MRKRFLIVATLFVVFAVCFAVLYYFLSRADATDLVAGAVNSAPSDDADKQLRALHQGAPPCLRYPQAVDARESEAAAAMLLDADVDRTTTAALVAHYLDWNDASERERHRLDKTDETFETLARPRGIVDRAILYFARRRLRKEEEASMETHRARARDTWASLSSEKQRAIRAAYNSHPTAFTLTGLLKVMHAMSVNSTRRQMERLAPKIADYARTHGDLPRSLDRLGLPPQELRDGWDNDLRWENSDGSWQIISYGADGAPGGTGDDADIVHTIPIAARTADAPATPESPCGLRLPAATTIKRAELDTAFANPDTLQHRFSQSA